VMKMFVCKTVILGVLVGIVTAGVAGAAIIGPAGLTATASSGYPGYVSRIPHVVNGEGMTSATEHTNGWGSWYTDGVDPDRWIVVDLGGSYELDSMNVWNGNDQWGWSVIGFDQTEVYVANMAAPGNPVGDAGNWTLVATQTLTQAPGTPGYNTPDIVDLLGTTGTHVALRSLTATGAYGDDRAGLSEIQVFEVPEPATIALLGFGFVGLLRRKRNGS
jgi:hypothetical protein